MMPKINKKLVSIISIVVVLIFLAFVGWALYQKGKVLPGKKVVPEALPEKEETMEEVLERLTPKEPKPLTVEEQKEQEKLLKQLTPTKPKPMTEKQQKELEELLKKLTPK